MAFSSGIGTYIRELVPRLNRPPFRLRLLVDRLGSSWCSGIEQILFSAPIYSIREQLLYPIKIPSCDLFWSPHYNVPLFPIRAKKRVVTIHDAYHLALGSFAEKTYARLVMRHAVTKSDRVVTVSQFSRAELQKYFGEQKIAVIPLAVNRERFQNSPTSHTAIRKKYRLPEKFVLFVGNFKPHKNISGLIRAFSKASLPGYELVLVGKGTPPASVLSIGTVSDEELPTFYSLAQLLVFPSFYEGFGFPPLEAMSCGCPTVVSKAASIPEVCGDASFYIDPNCDEQMAAAIVRVVTDTGLRSQLIEKGFERVQLFHWEQTAERHRQLFEELLT